MILDTSFVIDAMRGSPPALALRDEIEGGSEPVRIPALVVYELWEGIERSRHPIGERELVEETLRAYSVLPFTVEHATRAGQVSGALARRGIRIADVDVMLAGMALAEDDVIVTRNARDFERVPDLRVRSY